MPIFVIRHGLPETDKKPDDAAGSRSRPKGYMVSWVIKLNKLCKLYALYPLLLALLFCLPSSLQAKITGSCSNCHTMHNSQGGSPMRIDNNPAPLEALLRNTCFGCHARGIDQNIDPANGAPQVFRSGAQELAGGDFAYITGAKGSGASDRKGHNVIELGKNDATLAYAPGYLMSAHNFILLSNQLTCAGYIGCHGTRIDDGHKKGIPMIKGSHHQNIDGKCDSADQIYNSYRFLLGVKGFENTTDKWQNKDVNSHNEYYGATTPMNLNCGAGNCHIGGSAQPLNHTISGFCATCHGQFHDLASIGGDTSSPFTRHPSDVILPSDSGKEYRLYNTPDGTAKGPYSVIAPVARPTVYDSPSSTVTPGTDIVICLSCHGSHATDYPYMLRWDYKGWPGNGQTNGCNVCHTSKN